MARGEQRARCVSSHLPPSLLPTLIDADTLTHPATRTANALWDALDAQNRALGELLTSLGALHDADPATYGVVVKYLSTLQYRQWLAHPSIPEGQLGMISAFAGVRDVSEVRAPLSFSLSALVASAPWRVPRVMRELRLFISAFPPVISLFFW